LDITTKSKGICGIEFEAGSVAAAEVRENGDVRLTGAAVSPLPPGLVREGEIGDPDALTVALREMFAEHKLNKRVRIGVANQRVVVRTMRLPLIEKSSDLENAIRAQAADHIPMPLEQAVLEHQIIGRSGGGGESEPMIDVIVIAARREMIKGLVDATRKAGLRPEGVDLSAFGMIRALRDATESEFGATPSYEERMSNPQIEVPAILYCNLGDVINLAVARGDMCLFTRVSQFGFEGIVQRLAERRELNLEHARQWLAHVGLREPVESIEGDPEIVIAARDVLAEGASKLVDELRMSLDYYGAQEGAVAVESVVACGTGTTIPGLVEQIERELGLRVASPRPQALEHLDPMAAARLTLPLGLGMGR
jgi:type IV pilus assembly protein PilM